MSYQVIARKWRPQSFQELVGQDHVTQTLLNALRSGRLPHALLFAGARGVGKTSSARIFAKSLRCPNAKDFVPCNQCSVCEEVGQGINLDVIEIDGASNNGVDAIRELRETVSFMPASGKYKVYIIDEVHMLSTSAFNALLKTLEEPPAHVVFIFATTEAQKIPITILSRCQRFDFRRIPTKQIAERLTLICQSEGVEFETEALWTIARQAEGALRDSQSLLDQAITFCDGKITQDKVVSILGLTDRALLHNTLSSLVNRNVNLSMQVVESLYTGGYDASVFVQDLLEQLRHLLIVKMNPSQSHEIVDLPDSEIESLSQLATQLTAEDVHLLFDMALKGASDLIRSQNPRVVLEMLLLRMANAPRIQNLAQYFSGQPNATAPQVAAPSITQVKTTITRVAPHPQQMPPSTPPPAPVKQILYDEKQSLADNWVALIEKVKKIQPSLGAKLEYLAATEITANGLKIIAKDQLVYSQMNDKAVQLKLQSYIKTYWDKTLELLLEVAKGDEAPLSPKESTELKTKTAEAELLETVENHPLVKKTQDTFKTKITSIKEQS